MQVDSELRVDEVAQMFGHFVKFSATEIGGGSALLQVVLCTIACIWFNISVLINRPNAFEVLILASKRLAMPKIFPIKNKKQ